MQTFQKNLEDFIKSIKVYHSKNEHILIPLSENLARKMQYYRNEYKVGRFRDDEIQLLEDLSFWTWKRNNEQAVNTENFDNYIQLFWLKAGERLKQLVPDAAERRRFRVRMRERVPLPNDDALKAAPVR